MKLTLLDHVFNNFQQRDVSNAFSQFNYFILMCPEIYVYNPHDKIDLHFYITQVACIFHKSFYYITERLKYSESNTVISDLAECDV